jgi:hypothetical protein
MESSDRDDDLIVQTPAIFSTERTGSSRRGSSRFAALPLNLSWDQPANSYQKFQPTTQPI